MGKKRTKSTATTAAKKQKKSADSSIEEEDQTAGLIVAPVAKAKATTAGNKKSAEDKKSLSANVIADLQYLAAKGRTGKLTANDFVSLTVKDIKHALRLNDRTITGNRADVIEQAIDCMTQGCPPRCPTCGGGRLRFGARGQSGGGHAQYWCPGYMDDDEFIYCDFTAMKGDIDLMPWKDPK